MFIYEAALTHEASQSALHKHEINKEGKTSNQFVWDQKSKNNRAVRRTVKVTLLQIMILNLKPERTEEEKNDAAEGQN